MVREFQDWAHRQKAPVAMGFAASLIVASLVCWFSRLQGIEMLIFDRAWLTHPWTLLTYPWAYMPLGTPYGILGLVFLVMWISWMGPSVEQDMGSARFAVFLAALAALPALFIWIGALILKTNHIPLIGPWLPVAGLTIAWCTRNPTATIRIWGVLPLSGKWLGWLDAAGVFFSLGFGSPVLGLFACGHLALAWAFASDRLPIPYEGGRLNLRVINGKEDIPATRGSVRYDESYYDEVRRREKDRSERERLAKLFGEPPEDDGTAARH